MPAAPVEFRDRRFTRADLEHMPDDGRRYELIDGVLIVSAAPGRVHQRAAFSLARLLFEAGLIAWQLPSEREFRQVADVSGEAAFEATMPFPVRVVPADLVRWPPVT